MFPDESEIRRALAGRRPPSRNPWPEIRQKLDERSPRRATLAIVAALLVFFATAEGFRRAATERVAPVDPGFRVTDVSKEGRPANALVVQPDSNTIVVLAQ